jgi:two-component system LytT family response regulator
MSSGAPIRTLIVDDEAPARTRLRHLLRNEADFVVAGECANGREAVAAIRRERPDLVFLDVQMPSPNGFQVCAEVGVEQMPCIVFVTAYDRYALQAFEVHAVDYLLKPIDAERFSGTLRLLRQRLRSDADKSGGGQRLGALLAELDLYRRAKERLAVKADGRVLFLRTADIDWLEAEGNYVRLHVGGAAHLCRDTLCALEAGLPGERFLRVSRSAIVNVDAVKELQPLFYGDHVVIMRDGTRITLSRNYRDRLKKLLPH